MASGLRVNTAKMVTCGININIEGVGTWVSVWVVPQVV